MHETGSIAVPVLIDGTATCSIAITYISSALKAQEAARRYGDLLKSAADEIASTLGVASNAGAGRAESG